MRYSVITILLTCFMPYSLQAMQYFPETKTHVAEEAEAAASIGQETKRSTATAHAQLTYEDFEYEDTEETKTVAEAETLMPSTESKTKHDSAFDGTGFPVVIQTLIKEYMFNNNPVNFMQATTVKQEIEGATGDFGAVISSTQFATVDSNNNIRIFNTTTGKLIRTIPNASEIDTINALGNGNIITTSRDHLVRIFNTETGAVLQTFPGDTIALMPDGNLAAITNGNPNVQILNPETGTLLRFITLPDEDNRTLQPRTLAIFPNNDIALCSFDGIYNYLHIHNSTTNESKLINKFPGGHSIISVHITPENLIAACFKISVTRRIIGSKIYLYNPKDGKEVLNTSSSYGIISHDNPSCIHMEQDLQPITAPCLQTPMGGYLMSSFKGITSAWGSNDGLYLVPIKRVESYLWDYSFFTSITAIRQKNIEWVLITPDGRQIIILSQGKSYIYAFQDRAVYALQQLDTTSCKKLRQLIESCNKQKAKLKKEDTSVMLTGENAETFIALPDSLQKCLQSHYPISIDSTQSVKSKNSKCIIQ